MKLHQLRHQDTPTFQCDQCSRSYFSKGNVRTGTNVMSCVLGDNLALDNMPRQMNLMILRTTARVLSSRQDRELLFLSGDLNRHNISVHTVGRPYSCKICDKQFTRLQNFTEHMNTHIGITDCVPEILLVALIHADCTTVVELTTDIEIIFALYVTGLQPHTCSGYEARFEEYKSLHRHTVHCAKSKEKELVRHPPKRKQTKKQLCASCLTWWRNYFE